MPSLLCDGRRGKDVLRQVLAEHPTLRYDFDAFVASASFTLFWDDTHEPGLAINGVDTTFCRAESSDMFVLHDFVGADFHGVCFDVQVGRLHTVVALEFDRLAIHPLNQSWLQYSDQPLQIPAMQLELWVRFREFLVRSYEAIPALVNKQLLIQRLCVERGIYDRVNVSSEGPQEDAQERLRNFLMQKEMPELWRLLSEIPFLRYSADAPLWDTDPQRTEKSRFVNVKEVRCSLRFCHYRLSTFLYPGVMSNCGCQIHIGRYPAL
jgi:hypothetical protein